jgi:hypothetical protein
VLASAAESVADYLPRLHAHAVTHVSGTPSHWRRALMSPPPAPPAAAPAGARVTLEASELTWVSLRDAGGNQMLARLFAAADTQSFDLPNGATLRVGNAGGLNVLLNGKPIGSIGPRGKVRDVVFRNGSYKIVASD